MIKKSVFEDELISGMQRKLAEVDLEDGINSLSKAVDYINSAIGIFEENRMFSKADELLSILLKIANKKNNIKHDKCSPTSSEKMVKNLLHHGTVFNCCIDENLSDDILEVEDLPISDSFEDEID